MPFLSPLALMTPALNESRHLVIDPDQFDNLAREIARLNHLDEETAMTVLSFIGDTPNLDENDKAIVKLADGRELRIQMPEDEPA